ncbi:MAG TPA: MaoC family dehydratase [Pseudonocardia sp.]|nr:MaoC family dehydratase [Pseudonocardia sp.]
MAGLAEIARWFGDRVGEHTGFGAWHRITAEHVRGFADATLDWQWIHLDAQRAASGPYGGPVAHGFHLLALVPHLTSELFDLRWTEYGINFRVDRVRFRAPVPVGSRVRSGATLTGARVRPRELLELTLAITVDVEHGTGPACTLDHTRLYGVRPDAPLPEWGVRRGQVLDARPSGAAG